MLRQLFITCLVAVLPIAANATSTASIINTSCSGNLTSSLTDGASFACAGNLTLDGGFITSDSEINISADGDLFIDNINLNAPNIYLSNLSGLLNISSSAVIQASSSIFINSNYINIAQGTKTEILSNGKVVLTPNTNLVINSGGDINIKSGELSIQAPVPEPSTYLMALFGLSLIAFKRRTNR
jgi:adhesin HecA-like repeat protein